MKADGCVIGIDIGGTTTSLALVSQTGCIVWSVVVPTDAVRPAEHLVMMLCNTITEMCGETSGRPDILAIGIGAPNANYHRGTVENPVNLNWGASTNLVELFQQRFPVPVAITNDANAAALGELLFGGARGMKDVIVITLGTGLGSGIIVNGGVVYGADGFAGELGHTVVEPDGRACACGNRGCLETYVSATGLCRTVSELCAVMGAPSPLRDVCFNQLTARQVYEEASRGDVIALAAFDRTARILGMKLADAVAHTRPEAIFLAGGMAAAGDLLLEPARLSMDQFLFGAYRGKVSLLPSSLAEQNGAVLGAAALAWQELAIMTRS